MNFDIYRIAVISSLLIWGISFCLFAILKTKAIKKFKYKQIKKKRIFYGK